MTGPHTSQKPLLAESGHPFPAVRGCAWMKTGRARAERRTPASGVPSRAYGGGGRRIVYPYVI
jgi:hypothetical protein